MNLRFSSTIVPSDWREIETSDEAVVFITRMLRSGQFNRDWTFILAKATKDLHGHDSFDSERKMDARENDKAMEAEYRHANDR